MRAGAVHRLGVATADAKLQLEALQNGEADFSTVDSLTAAPARAIGTPRVRKLTGNDAGPERRQAAG